MLIKDYKTLDLLVQENGIENIILALSKISKNEADKFSDLSLKDKAALYAFTAEELDFLHEHMIYFHAYEGADFLDDDDLEEK